MKFQSGDLKSDRLLRTNFKEFILMKSSSAQELSNADSEKYVSPGRKSLAWADASLGKYCLRIEQFMTSRRVIMLVFLCFLCKVFREH